MVREMGLEPNQKNAKTAAALGGFFGRSSFRSSFRFLGQICEECFVNLPLVGDVFLGYFGVNFAHGVNV